LQAFKLLKVKYEIPEKLVIVGAKGWKFSPMYEWIEANQLHNDVLFTGFVKDEDLVSIYNGASLFAMPSIYEGFGLPVLEAMQCGIPVIGSDISSLPEIIGSFGKLVDPHDYESWASEIYSLLTNDILRDQYVKLSIERSKQFSWKKTAAETKVVYDKVLNQY
jgi:glycosyltransferase involved in cell wall biosynthesis